MHTLVRKSNQSNVFAALVTHDRERFHLSQGIQLPNILFNLLQPLRQWLDEIEIQDAEMARFLSKLIPAQCPFERDIILLGRKVGHIPPLCKLNPFYEQLVGLRFRALCFLADQCGENIQSYCS
jgi:hypothetical protein